MKGNDLLRKELLALLSGGEAHMDFADVVARFPMVHINSKAPHTPYSCWHFVEHLRIAQWDILQFIINPDHVSPEYPEGYRPQPDEKTDEAGWERSVAGVLEDLEQLREIVTDRATDFFAPLPHAPNYTIFREILLAADHNAYHIGELALLRQVLGIWPKGFEYLAGRA
ncbi:DinB family protein [Geotalea sp. SG265]|uniref:DinB family protein n=1 Tax=Geotalea sp. SG265 TaxID=2922867 RepID=UPI001FAF532D|nr:DinB family protein [Geotalea sp. SG265]